jgi:copper chaperone
MMARYRVKGMTCGGCARAVTNAIRVASAAARVDVDVDVDVAGGTVAVDDAVPEATIAKAVGAAGFEFIGRI